MKKSIALLLAVLLIFSLAACSANKQNASATPDTDRDQESTVTPTEESRPENDVSSTGSNILIAYFSVPEDVDTDGVDTISQLQPGALMMGNELVLSRNDVAESEETVVTWAKELGINAKTELPEGSDGSTVLTAAADAHNSQTLYLWEEGNAPATTECDRPHGFGCREGWFDAYDSFLTDVFSGE